MWFSDIYLHPNNCWLRQLSGRLAVLGYFFGEFWCGKFIETRGFFSIFLFQEMKSAIECVQKVSCFVVHCPVTDFIFSKQRWVSLESVLSPNKARNEVSY